MRTSPSPRVRPLVSLVGPLEVLRRNERDRIESVADREQRDLRALEQLLDDEPAAERRHRLQGVVELRLGPAHVDAPSRPRDRRPSRHTAAGQLRAATRSERRRPPAPPWRRPWSPRSPRRLRSARRPRSPRDEGRRRLRRRAAPPARSPRDRCRARGRGRGVPPRPRRESDGIRRDARSPGSPARHADRSGRRLRELPGERVLTPTRPDQENTHRTSLGVGLAGMDHTDFQQWLDAYVDAWTTYDEAAIGELFTEDARYRYHPWDEGDEALAGARGDRRQLARGPGRAWLVDGRVPAVGDRRRPGRGSRRLALLRPPTERRSSASTTTSSSAASTTRVAAPSSPSSSCSGML